MAGLAAVAGGAAAGTAALLRQRARRRAAARVSGLVLEACELIAAELGAGLPPGRCLDRAAREWPPLAAVAEAFRMGADVPAAFRQVAAAPGAADLRLVAAAWQVAHRTGQGLGRTRWTGWPPTCAPPRPARRVVEGELASARATARLVAGAAAAGPGDGLGGRRRPVGLPARHPRSGSAASPAGLALGLAGLAWIEAIARDVGPVVTAWLPTACAAAAAAALPRSARPLARRPASRSPRSATTAAGCAGPEPLWCVLARPRRGGRAWAGDPVLVAGVVVAVVVGVLVERAETPAQRRAAGRRCAATCRTW